ncbi:MAG: phage protein GemA/Gp16 family protein [Filifactoraceae bacterium]
MAVMKKMEDWQRKIMFALANRLNISKEDLYAMANVDSMKDLPYDKAQEVIKRLKNMAETYEQVKEKRKETKIPGMITKPQQDKIWALMFELQKYDKEVSEASVRIRLVGIIKRELKIATTENNPFVWMNFEAGHKLIEMLKGYVVSAKRGRR